MNCIIINKSPAGLIIALILLPLSNLFGQVVPANDSTVIDSAHQFLWFKGHWNPSNKKQFIIEKDSTSGITGGGGGNSEGTVTVEPDGSVRIKSGGIDQWNKKVDEALKTIDDWENKLETPISPDLTSYHLNQLLLPDVKKEKEEYTNYKIDPKQNVLNPDNEKQAIQKMTSAVASYCQDIKPKYDGIMAFYNAHRKDKDADLNIPPPPEFEYNCYACDSDLRKVYDTTIAHYVRDFHHPEDSLVQQGLDILRSFILLGIGPEGQGTPENMQGIVDLFHIDKKDPSKSGACSYLDLYKLNTAVLDIAHHSYSRAQELVRRYHKRYKAATAIIKTYLSIAHDWAMISGNVNSNDYLPELGSMVEDNFNFYLDKLKQHDWKQLANIPFMISLIRQKELLGGNEDNNNLMSLCSQVSDILNNFHLNVDMDIKAGKDGGYMLAHLKGETKIAPDFAQEDNQCYRWVVVEDQPKEIFKGLKEPVKKESQKIDIDLLANQYIAPSPIVPVYVGTHKYYTLLKELKMDYCNPGKDSILLTGFIPSPDARAGIWKIPQSPPAPLGINQLDHFFQDTYKMQEIAESGDAVQQAAIMKQQGEELKAKMQSLAGQMGNGKTKDNLNKYIELQKMVTQSQDIGNSAKIAPVLYITFALPVQNSKVLLDKKYDAKQINPKEAFAIVYGYYSITIEFKKDF